MRWIGRQAKADVRRYNERGTRVYRTAKGLQFSGRAFGATGRFAVDRHNVPVDRFAVDGRSPCGL